MIYEKYRLELLMSRSYSIFGDDDVDSADQESDEDECQENEELKAARPTLHKTRGPLKRQYM